MKYDIRHFLTDDIIDRFPDFAREFVRTGNAASAIQRARIQNPMYSMSVWAQKLLADEQIQALIEAARVEEETQPKRVKEFTRESIAEDFQAIYEKAMDTNALSPAVTAKAKQAELLGLMEKNVRVTVSTNVNEMSMEELERELKRLTDDGVITLTQNADGVYE